MAAGLTAEYFGASATLPAGVSAEAGATYNREDTLTGITPIPVPVNPGTNYSWLKTFQLAVTTTSTTTITNRTVRLSQSLPTGVGIHWKTDTQANWGTTFNQTGGSKAPADTTGANNAGTAPTGYTAMTTSAVQYDNTSQVTSATGIGAANLLGTALAADASYLGGPGTPALGSIIFAYDEA